MNKLRITSKVFWEGPGGQISVSRLDRFVHAGYTIAVASELEENEGASIAQGSEQLWAKVLRDSAKILLPATDQIRCIEYSRAGYVEVSLKNGSHGYCGVHCEHLKAALDEIFGMGSAHPDDLKPLPEGMSIHRVGAHINVTQEIERDADPEVQISIPYLRPEFDYHDGWQLSGVRVIRDAARGRKDQIVLSLVMR